MRKIFLITAILSFFPSLSFAGSYDGKNVYQLSPGGKSGQYYLTGPTKSPSAAGSFTFLDAQKYYVDARIANPVWFGSYTTTASVRNAIYSSINCNTRYGPNYPGISSNLVIYSVSSTAVVGLGCVDVSGGSYGFDFGLPYNIEAYDPTKAINCPNPEAESSFLSTCKDGIGIYDCYEPTASTCENGPETCDNLTDKCISQCGSIEEVQSFDCTDEGNGNIAQSPCVCTPKSCADETASCISQCGGQENVQSFNCTDGVVDSPCECTNPDVAISNGSNPNKDIIPQTIDSTNASNDKIVESINESNRIAAKAANQSASDNAALGAKINNLGNIISGAIKNLASGLSSLLNGIQSTLSSIKNAITDNSYTPFNIGESYILPEVDFGARLTDFVDTVKTSSLFSLPNSAFNVPGGGSSQLTINGGETFGVHVFDFADMSNFWAVLKSIVLCGFSFVAVRIVCLKGGSQ